MVLIEISEVGVVNWGARKDASSRHRGEQVTRVGERVRVWQVQRNDLVATVGVGDDPKGSADLIR